MRKCLLFLTLAALLLVSAGVVLAQSDEPSEGMIWVYTEDYGRIPMFTDGRLNAFDLAAPVAVYYTAHEERFPNAPTISVADGVQLLAIDPVTSEGNLVLDVPVEEIRNAIDEHLVGTDGLIAEQNGYSLHYAAPGWFWVSAPADAEGKVYNFVWPDRVLHPEP
jgi:hypothetical protein